MPNDGQKSMVSRYVQAIKVCKQMKNKIIKNKDKLIKKVYKMELGNPVLTTLVGLVIFYIGLKMFSGGKIGRAHV